MKCSLGISNFLEEISSLLFCSFPLFLCIDRWRRLSYLSCYSLELCIQMLISFLFSFAFPFSSFHSYLWALPRQAFCFFACLSMGMVLIPVSCTMSGTSIHEMITTPQMSFFWEFNRQSTNMVYLYPRRQELTRWSLVFPLKKLKKFFSFIYRMGQVTFRQKHYFSKLKEPKSMLPSEKAIPDP